MFEDKTTDSLTTDMLNEISDNYEKSVGYLTYDLIKAFAIELSDIYKNINYVDSLRDIDNLTGDDLARTTEQYKGIQRKLGNFATTNLTINGNGTVKIGDLFQTKSGIPYACTTETIIDGTGTISVQCQLYGTLGNVPANTIIQIPRTIAGIISCTNINKVDNGYDDETDDSLRQRYYTAIREPATSGNRANYVQWATNITGVGGVQVFGNWNGDNTVKLVIIDSNKQPATTELVLQVQNYIDPKGVFDESTNTWSTWGGGYGEAPIGAYCTVESATAKNISISVSIIKSNSNYTDEEIITNITNSVNTYLKTVAFNEENPYISYAKIGNYILDAEGVGDYSNLTINGGTSNIILSLTKDLCETPVLTEVNLI